MTATHTSDNGPMMGLTLNGPGGLIEIGQAPKGKIRIRVNRGAKSCEMTMSRTAWQSLKDGLWRLDYTAAGESLTPPAIQAIPTDQEAAQ